MKENSDVESSESSENSEKSNESGEEGNESGEEGGESGEEIEKSGEEMEESGEEIDDEEGNESGEEGGESGEEIEKSGEEMEESGEEIEGEEVEVEVEEIEVEEIEVDEVESPGARVGPDTIDSGGFVGSGRVGCVGPTGSAGPASITGSSGAKSVVPVVSILPPTPVKNKGKGKGTPDDNQEDILLADFDPDSLRVDNDEPGGLKCGRERSGTGDVRGSKTHRRSASHSTAPTVPSTEDDDVDDDDVDDDDDVKDLDKIHPDVDDDDVEDLDEIHPQGSSRSTGGFSQGRAAGNNFNWGDVKDVMDPPDWNASTYGKVLLFVNRDPGTAPYMSFSTETTSELPVVLKELSGRFSPIERRDSRIYVYEEETWEVKGRFSQAVKDKTPLQWEMNDGGKLVLNLLAVGVFFFILFHIYNLNHFQDDLVDENMNLKSASGSAAGSIYIKSSASGSAASSFVAPSDTAETDYKSSKDWGPMQQILVDTFKTSPHLLQRKKQTDLRLAYSKYLAIRKMIEDVNAMERAAAWTHAKPTVEDIARVFMSRSGYFNRPRQLFPRVKHVPEMLKWLEGGEDAPEESDVWGDKKPSFKHLKEILDFHAPETGKGKGKGKAKAQAGGGSKKKAGPTNKKAGPSNKKAGPSNSRQNDD